MSNDRNGRAREGSDALGRLAELYVAVVADSLDRLGHRAQVMHPDMRPRTVTNVVVGAAYPVRAVKSDMIHENPYEHELAAVDAVPNDSILVFDTEETRDAAVWGELLATRAASRGCRGAVIDGGIRDLRALTALEMPTWSTAVTANDSRGRLDVVTHGDLARCGGVEVRRGDIVVADLDGVVVIPHEIVDEVTRVAIEKVGREQRSRSALAAGRTAASVYAQYGVL